MASNPNTPPRPFDPRKTPDEASMRQVPKLRDAVEGWRVWQLDRTPPLYGNPPKLESITHGRDVDGGYWTPRRAAEAVCTKYAGRPEDMPENHVASLGCACGFYSAKSLDHLREIGYTLPSTLTSFGHSPDSHTIVIGRVACWGTVTEGSLGWRSQFCYPKALFVPPECRHLIAPLKEAYGVPTVLTLFLDIDPEN